jgi:pSer/pThr/pTyr-binding forkhead associated (FHA) protein
METPLILLHLTPANGASERKTINVPIYPDTLRIGRQTGDNTLSTPQNGHFDSKVMSRQHAEVWADVNGRVFIRDVKSSNGTYVNGHRLSQEHEDSDPYQLQERDLLELGIDIMSDDQETVAYPKIAALVEHVGFESS